MKKNKKILVDMSASIIHHGHIRLLKKASKYGEVTVGLTTDSDLKKFKKINPEIKFRNRAEILRSIKYVNKVVQIEGFHIQKSNLHVKTQIQIVIDGLTTMMRMMTRGRRMTNNVMLKMLNKMLTL